MKFHKTEEAPENPLPPSPLNHIMFSQKASPFNLIECYFLDQLPDLNFAFHCGTPVNQEHPRLLRCPIIEQGIRECQARGKKVAISLGGATGNGLLASKDRAETLANNLWQLFLGGTGMGFDALRPFGT